MMADVKRNNMAGKIATPRTGASSPATQPLADPLETLGKAIGARIKITTVAPSSQTYEGSLFTACPILNIVAINTRQSLAQTSLNAATQPGDYTVVPVSKIQSFQIISLPEQNGSDGSLGAAHPVIGLVDVKSLRAREEAHVRQLKEEEKHRGKGVTREAQAIYNSFKRINMPIRWHNQDMVVHEAVIISPPYRVEDCKGPKDKQEVLNRVKKVLEGERKKLQEKEELGQRAAAGSVSGPRKGG